MKQTKLNYRISIRCTEEEKHIFDEKVKKSRSSQREFLMDCLSGETKNEKPDNQQRQKNLRNACKLQSAVNHIREKYPDDKYLRKVCDEIWENL